MKSTLHRAGLLAGLLFASGLAMAQASAPAGARARMPCADAPAGASAPAAGCGPRAGMGPGMREGASAPMHGRRAMGPRTGADWTPGWSMMSAEERREHHDRMAGAKTHDECRAELERHRQAMAERARTQGRPAPGMPRRDPCAGLKPKG